MTFDPQHLADTLLKHGRDWAEQRAAADLLSETRKTLKSQLALKFLPEVGAVNKAEMMAEATKEYIDHIHAMIAAEKEANLAEVQYKTDQTYVDLIRSEESTKRAEMTLR